MSPGPSGLAVDIECELTGSSVPIGKCVATLYEDTEIQQMCSKPVSEKEKEQIQMFQNPVSRLTLFQFVCPPASESASDFEDVIARLEKSSKSLGEMCKIWHGLPPEDKRLNSDLDNDSAPGKLFFVENLELLDESLTQITGVWADR